MWILKCYVRLADLTNWAIVLTVLARAFCLPLSVIWAEIQCLSQGFSPAASGRSRELSNKQPCYQNFVRAHVSEKGSEVSWQQAFLPLLQRMFTWLCPLLVLSANSCHG